VPTEGKELAEVVAREHGNIHRSAELNAEAVMRLLERCDAIRQAERFKWVLQACECDARGRLGFEEAAYPQAGRLLKAQQAALCVETAPIAQAAAAQGLKGLKIGEKITQARTQAIAQVL
jgi:tRNA nucleotidyltransferase (CCA-adding enzyme)